MKQILVSLLAELTLLTSSLPFANKMDTDTVWDLVNEAYVYVFPLVLADATKTVSTNTDATMTGRVHRSTSSIIPKRWRTHPSARSLPRTLTPSIRRHGWTLPMRR